MSNNLPTTFKTATRSSTATAKLSPSSSSSLLYSTPSVTIPSKEIHNPYLQETAFKQGTFYAIFLPIVAGFVLAFVLGSAYHRFKAKSQARLVNLSDDSFDSDLESKEDAKYFSRIGRSERSSLDLLKTRSDLQSMRSSTHSFEALMRSYSNNELQKDFTKPESLVAGHLYTQQQAVLQKQQQQQQIRAAAVKSGSVLQLKEQDLLSGPSNLASTYAGSSNYSLAEPEKAVTQSSVSIPNNKSHFHKKTISSVLLDEFISTGELPKLDADNNVVGNSMYGVNANDSYKERTSRSASPTRNSSPVRSIDATTPKQTQYVQSPSRSPSRSPTRSPTRSSPTRNLSRSPSRSPTRDPSRSPTKVSRNSTRNSQRSPTRGFNRGVTRSLHREASHNSLRSPTRSLTVSPSRSAMGSPIRFGADSAQSFNITAAHPFVANPFGTHREES